jgi:glyoxylase-like metal-dependent hydrolase (beta-lactamase superfamily II)
LIDFGSAAPVAGSLDVAWNHGTRGRSTAEGASAIQVHRYDEHTIIMRQGKAVNYEAPFIFLLFGNERALLLDTGATEDSQLFPLRATVDGLIDAWLGRHPRGDYELVVAHTHAHGDHVAGDAQFEGRPHTMLVGKELDAVQAFFGFDIENRSDTANRPAESVSFDLGGRVLEIFLSPGHHATAITCYDPWSAILFTGDTVLPGRLYASDFPAFCASMDRMVAFAESHPVRHVFGCHVEMTRRPGRDYPIGAEYQPHERAPEMTVAQLKAVRDAARAVAAKKGVHRFDDFIIYNEPGEKDMRKLVRRGERAKRVARLRAIFGL